MPPLRTVTIREARFPKAQVSAPPAPTSVRPLSHRFMHSLAPVSDFSEMHRAVHLAISGLLDASQSHSGDLTAWIDFQYKGLKVALFYMAILETNDEWGYAMHYGSSALEQESCPFRATRHQRFLVFVQHKYHMSFPFRGPLQGCVTCLERHFRTSPLANVGSACSALRTARTPDGLLATERQGSELRKHSEVP